MTQPRNHHDELAPPPVDTEEYRRSSAFSRLLRRGLRRAILPRCDAEKRPAYAEQFDEGSRNVEIMVEGLLGLLRRHPIKTAHILRALQHWRGTYYPMQNECRERLGYLIYTQHDRPIPFIPESDTLYAYMVCQISYVARQIAELVSVAQMRHVADTFMELNSTAIEAFRQHPTLMPRLTDHDRITLMVVQKIDDPTNCCPSLHIAYSMLLDNLAQFLIRPMRKKAEVFTAIRYSTIGMFNSVLYTKQHSILDVAFGMLCARLVFEKAYDYPYDDFTSSFAELQTQHPIPYGEIAALYHEACELQREHGSLSDTLGAFLRLHGYPRLRCDADIGHAYFDTTTREVVDLPAGA